MENKIKLTEMQEDCLEKMIVFINNAEQQSFNLSGYSGVGKSTIVQFLIKSFPHKHIIACTPTHRANEVLGSMLMTLDRGVEIKTIASLFGVRHNPLTRKYEMKSPNEEILRPNSILLVDECGMTDNNTFIAIVTTCIERNIKVIFIGDIAQIPPVKSDSVSLSFTDCDDSYLLTQLMRQNPSNPLVNIYTAIRNNMLSKHIFVSKLNEEGEGLEIVPDRGQFLGAIDYIFTSDEFKTNKSYSKIICFRNIKVREYNDHVRKLTIENPDIEYQVGEILTGYTQISANNIIENSKDYVIVKNDGIIKHSFYSKTPKNSQEPFLGKKPSNFSYLESKKFELNSYCLTIKPINSASMYGIKIYIPLLDNAENQPFFQNLYTLSQQQAKEKITERKNELYRALVDVFSNIQLNESLFLYDGKCTSLPKVKIESPELFEVDFTGSSEFERIMDEHSGYVLEKNIDYGYAVSCHKVQGGTFSTVLVDLRDLSHPATNKIIYKGEDKYSLLRNNLIYVALSRCKIKAIAYQ